MKRVLWIFLLMLLIAACNNHGNNDSVVAKAQQDSINLVNKAPAGNDSIELTTLIRKMYKWHTTIISQDLGDFPVKEKDTSDNLCHGIDWTKHNEMLKKIKETGFFSQDFLNTYQGIAFYINKSLADGTVKWDEGEAAPFPGFESDPWTKSQDYPANWDGGNLIIKDLQVANDTAGFSWAWEGDLAYKVKAKKENGLWKISSLAGFDLNNYLAETGNDKAKE